MFRHIKYVIGYISLGMFCFVCGVLFSDLYVSLGMYVPFGMYHFIMGVLLFWAGPVLKRGCHTWQLFCIVTLSYSCNILGVESQGILALFFRVESLREHVVCMVVVGRFR
jgi:hypothetical protein